MVLGLSLALLTSWPRIFVWLYLFVLTLFNATFSTLSLLAASTCLALGECGTFVSPLSPLSPKPPSGRSFIPFATPCTSCQTRRRVLDHLDCPGYSLVRPSVPRASSIRARVLTCLAASLTIYRHSHIAAMALSSHSLIFSMWPELSGERASFP